MIARRLPLSLAAYRRLTKMMTPIAPYVFETRLQRGKEDPERLNERRGEASLMRPDGSLVWVHGSSVGEVIAMLPLIQALCKRGFPVLLTSQTITSAQLAAQRLPQGAAHQFLPLDMPKYVARFLDHWRPQLALFGESELWPNLITQTTAHHIPLVLINGRLSQRSFRRWSLARGTIAALLGRFDLILAQSSDDAGRFDTLGATRVISTGNLKYDSPPPPVDETRLDMFRASLAGRVVVLGASTHPGEDNIILEAHQRLGQHVPRLLTLIAPRHPERGAEIAALAAARGLNAGLRSRGAMPDPSLSIYIADTIGELGLLYRSSSVCFVGGSLVRHGGQNPIEPAKSGSAILHGPHVWNFTDVYAALGRVGGAGMVHDATSLATSFARVLASPDMKRDMVGSAMHCVQNLSGALSRTLDALEPYIMQMQLEVRS